MAEEEQDNAEDWAVDSIDPSPREDGQPGPPDSWPHASWYDRQDNDWWWLGKRDPCPVQPVAHRDGEYIFVTAAGERRSFTASKLGGRLGLSDLFGGSLWWPLRHFRKYSIEEKTFSGGLQLQRCLNALMRACVIAGYDDGTTIHRSVGVWRGPDGSPVVHAGDRIFCDGEILGPGVEIGDALYVIGGNRQAPAFESVGRQGYRWMPADIGDCHTIGAHIDEWHWIDAEARDLYLGGLWCDMLGDAPLWKPHKFVRAPAGSGKSSLLRYTRALLGGAAHAIQRTYSKARLEDHFSHTSCALLLDEAEAGSKAHAMSEAQRVQQIFDLLLLLSDEGAVGGRYKRDIDLHGTATLVATLTEDWVTTIKSRVAYLELRPFRDRTDHPPVPRESIEAMIGRAGELSAAIRARALHRFDLFRENLALARKRVLELGGAPRDGDQLGHLIAGWATFTGDEPLDEDAIQHLDRFRPYILTVSDAEDGEDDPSELLNVILGLPAQNWRGGDQLTVGQLIARARDPDNTDFRRALLPYGLRLEKLPRETWTEAWLAVANKHPGLDRLLADYPQYRGRKRAQVLSGLRGVDTAGQVHEAKPSDRPLRFAGPQSRALLLPPFFLPSLKDERQDEPAPPEPIP